MESVLSVSNIKKTFVSKIKHSGLKGSFISLIKPEYNKAGSLAGLLMNAILTFALYPISLFDGPAKFVLFTIIPAALMGSIPASIVRRITTGNLIILLFGALTLLLFSTTIFRLGLRRYESGSAIQIEV